MDFSWQVFLQNPGWAWATSAEIQTVLKIMFLGFPGCLYTNCKHILGFQCCDVPVEEFWYQDIVIQRDVLAIQSLLCLL